MEPETSAEDDISGDNPATLLAHDFAAAARSIFAAGGLQDTLATLATLAVSSVEACDFAGVFLRRGQAVALSAQTDAVVAAIAALQERTGEGPCLDAITDGTSFYASDLGQDARWPSFGPAADTEGVRSLLALPLSLGVGGDVGALALYAALPAAFGVIDRARGLVLSSIGGLAYSVARLHDDEERRSHNLQLALATRELIGQAQGILIERERITGEQAFEILRRASQHLNVKLREVAQELVETGERPDTGKGPL